MTVKELIAELQKLPQEATIGVFSPFDGNGPCTYDKPYIFVNEDGNVQINPDSDDEAGFETPQQRREDEEYRKRVSLAESLEYEVITRNGERLKVTGSAAFSKLRRSRNDLSCYRTADDLNNWWSCS